MAVKTNDTNLEDLLKMVDNGKAQLPEFQRSWVWDDTRIKKLIESITSGFPMGAVMFLAKGGNTNFKSRKFTGVADTIDNDNPEWLVLDGQQRLTTLYQVFKCKNPTITCLDTDKDKIIKRYYYLDIKKALDPDCDRLEAIISVSEKKILTSEIGRTIDLDLSTREKEYENLMFPLNIVFDSNERTNWLLGLLNHNGNALQTFQKFQEDIIAIIEKYKLPVIELDKETTKEAVCQIFENVNTGGVPLTVFELITATFAADEYDLRDDWNEIRKVFQSEKSTVLKDITGANFLQSMTLLVTYKRSVKGQGTVSCKKRDILKLQLDEYKENRNALVEGFTKACKFLNEQGIYSNNELPYTSQLIPLAAIFAFDSNIFNLVPNRNKLAQWYWCGVFGELYGGANDARFALDIADIFKWISDNERLPETVIRSNFQPTRLLSLQTRNSAAYKGVMAIILQDSPLDFMSGAKMGIATYLEERTDIHHVFPQAYCEKNGLPKGKWNSVVNKSPIYATTNRSIGGRAPSEYIITMKNKGLSDQQIMDAIESHKIDYHLLLTDAFEEYFVDRSIKLLDRIEKAMGKSISGRDSDETINSFYNRKLIKE